jgi:methylthioribose-1-phosphate isomerase
MIHDTLRWKDGSLELLDQTLLPAEIVYRRYDSAAGVAGAIREMIIRGAPAIGCAAAYGVAAEALRVRHESRPVFDDTIHQAIELLAASRPTAVNLFWALERMKRLLGDSTDDAPSTTAARLLDEAHAILHDDVQRCLTMGALGAELLTDDSRVLTHCNAGALATAGHGTALGVIRSAVAAGKRIAVFAGETRPYLQGARLTAWEMVEENIPVTLITDGMSGHLMATGEIDAVIVGADRVAANGDVANKIGTYGIAVLAERHGIPFYVACPLSTVDMTIETGAGIPIEERAASEVTGYGSVTWAAPGVAVRNPAFDVTPASLVTALITERGVVHRPDREKMQHLTSHETVA